MNTVVLSAVTFVYLASFVVFLAALTSGSPRWERAGRVTALAGFIVHTAGIVLRWVESHRLGMGHAPLSNFYESLVFFSWSLVFLYLLYAWRRARGVVGAMAMPPAFLLMAYASFSPGVDSRIKPLIPALKSEWLIVHVITCFIGYAALLLASVLSLLAVCRKGGLGGAEALLDMQDRFLKTGYILFTLGIVTGSVWAHMAWGRYWGWDPKETWALITWLVYTAALHVRVRRVRPTMGFVAVMGAGLVCVLFTYFGVNYLPGLHSYR